MEYAVEAEELNINYGKASVLWDLTFQIPQGHLVGIIGPNGAGKSTLLKAALGLLKPLSGKISLLGKSAEEVRKKVAYVPQRGSVDWDFPITALEVVLMGRYGRLGLFGYLRKADREAAAAALEQVGMSAYAHRQISQLSGGQQQRLFLARALVQNADLFLLDEPFVGVDLSTEKEIMTLLQKQKELGKTILIVHHDLPSVEEYFDWVLLLNTRLLGCGPVKEVFTRENLARAFGKSQLLFDEAANLSAKSISGIL
ncbi:MAG TPA: metal ABC transporter ATP-binding protein [Chlamydiales bacterium]|nr:metal ABC transporter ATP-binding protein [Chlamydiales bacterium]